MKNLQDVINLLYQIEDAKSAFCICMDDDQEARIVKAISLLEAYQVCLNGNPHLRVTKCIQEIFNLKDKNIYVKSKGKHGV